MKNITISSAALSLFVSMLGMAAFVMVPSLAHAQEFGDSYSGGCCDISGSGYTAYPDTSYTAYPDTSYTAYPDTTSYSSMDYGSSGYSMPSYGVGGGFASYGGYGGAPSNTYAPTTVANNGNTSIFAPTNTCTAGNSCNTTTQINAPTTVTTNTSGGGGYNYPVYQPVYTPVYTPAPVYQPTYQPAYQPYQQPIAYNQPAPYVSLSAVPYTGLDLGPWGTAAYWGFLILWCLGAAYLIVVKRVQNKIVNKLNGFLFGTSQKVADQKSSGLLSEAKNASAGQTFAQRPSAPSSQFGNIDPFIASQISRAAF